MSGFDHEEERAEFIWQTVVKIILAPAIAGIIIAIITLISKL